LRAILSDEGVSESDFAARSAPWQEWLTSTKGFHEKLRSELRAMISLNLTDSATGTGGGSALIDSSELVARSSEWERADAVIRARRVRVRTRTPQACARSGPELE